MYNYSKFINVLQASGLTIQEAKYMVQFDGEGLDRYKDKFYDYNVKNAQVGGSRKSIKYNGKKYKFEKVEDMYGKLMFTLRQDITSGSDECIHISIEPSYNYAYIDDISNLEGCLRKGIITNKGGNDLLKILILLIYQIKDKYNLKYIQLRDNSTKYINGERIVLRNLMYLTKGRTWYEKFGFISCSIDTEGRMNFTPRAFKNHDMDTNMYMKKTVKDINLDKKDLYDIFPHNDKKLIKSLYKQLLDNKNMLIKDFIEIINTKKYSILLNTFLDEIVLILNLHVPQSMCVDINYAHDIIVND